ncbi:MAG: hypothetical protein CL946_11485 [Ectothiorhodospiraceae bacterium]|nr:hypothetical protein [Ectothiorhodospiraceae bacterium]
MKKLRYLLCLTLALAFTATAQPRAQEVMKNVRAQFDRVKDYTVDIRAKVDIPRVQVPAMEAKLYFKQPDKVHLKADGFAMIPKDAVSFNPHVFEDERYDMVVQGTESIGGKGCYKVKLLARSDTLRVQRAMVYVDSTDWLILRLESDPNQGRSAVANITYALIENKYFLPSKAEVNMDAPPMRLRPGQSIKKDEQEEGQQASASIEYSNYKVNTGLSDSLFEEESK